MTNEDDRARLRSYLVAQTEKYDLVDLWPRVVGQRLAFLQALDGVTEEQARWRPPTGEGEDAWSILEVTQHLAGWTDNVLGIVRGMSGGPPGEKLPVGHLDADDGKTLAQARRELTRASMRLAEAMSTDEATVDLGQTVEHALFGPLNARGWLLFQRIHDTDHVSQVERLKQTDGFPASPAR
ncbi:MAG: DinB family protein [Dehalococcoidia bacterium]